MYTPLISIMTRISKKVKRKNKWNRPFCKHLLSQIWIRKMPPVREHFSNSSREQKGLFHYFIKSALHFFKNHIEYKM